MRALWITLALILAPGLTKADVVYTRTDQPSLAYQFSSNSSGSFDTVGQSFLNIGQDSTATSVLFRLIASSGSFNTGSFSVSIYSAGSSASPAYAPAGPALFSSAAINLSSNVLSTTAQDFTFTTFTKNTAADLTANAAYVAVLQWSGLTFSSNSFEALGYSSRSGTYAAYNSVSNGNADQNQQLYSTIEVSAVPEPGTLLLGGIAAACGGGAWWRRKRHQASKATAKESIA